MGQCGYAYKSIGAVTKSTLQYFGVVDFSFWHECRFVAIRSMAGTLQITSLLVTPLQRCTFVTDCSLGSELRGREGLCNKGDEKYRLGFHLCVLS